MQNGDPATPEHWCNLRARDQQHATQPPFILRKPRMPCTPGSRNACTLAPALVSVAFVSPPALRPAQCQVWTSQTRTGARGLRTGERRRLAATDRAVSTWRRQGAQRRSAIARERCLQAWRMAAQTDHDGVPEVLNKARHGCSHAAASMQTAACGSGTCHLLRSNPAAAWRDNWGGGRMSRAPEPDEACAPLASGAADPRAGARASQEVRSPLTSSPVRALRLLQLGNVTAAPHRDDDWEWQTRKQFLMRPPKDAKMANRGGFGYREKNAGEGIAISRPQHPPNASFHTFSLFLKFWESSSHRRKTVIPHKSAWLIRFLLKSLLRK